MIKMGEFHVDTIGELKLRLISKQFRIVAQFHFVLAQMLHVFLDGNLQIFS